MGNQLNMFGRAEETEENEENDIASDPADSGQIMVAQADDKTPESEVPAKAKRPRRRPLAEPVRRVEILSPEPRPKFPVPQPPSPAKRGRKPLKSVALQLDEINVPDDEELFSKQYYPAGTVAGWLNIATPLLRSWSNEFSAIINPRKNRKGDRMYRPEEVKKLVLIHQLLRERKYSIEGARQYLLTQPGEADAQQQIYESLTRFRSFILALKANLGT